jgi:hypothetical protein
MQVMVYRIRVIVSGLVMVGIVASGVATCTAGEIMSETAQMACCEAGHHTCGKDGAPADCCRTNSTPQPQWNTVAKTDSLKAPFRLFLALVTPVNPLSDVAFVVQTSRSISASPPVQPPGPPVYILLSTFLI